MCAILTCQSNKHYEICENEIIMLEMQSMVFILNVYFKIVHIKVLAINFQIITKNDIFGLADVKDNTYVNNNILPHNWTWNSKI